MFKVIVNRTGWLLTGNILRCSDDIGSGFTTHSPKGRSKLLKGTKTKLQGCKGSVVKGSATVKWISRPTCSPPPLEIVNAAVLHSVRCPSLISLVNVPQVQADCSRSLHFQFSCSPSFREQVFPERNIFLRSTSNQVPLGFQMLRRKTFPFDKALYKTTFVYFPCERRE